MAPHKLFIRNAEQVVTCSGFQAKKGAEMSDLGLISHGSVLVENGIITAIGNADELSKQLKGSDYTEIDATGKALLPGFVDSHTHLVFGGYREEEFSWRLKGDSYMSIMERGGGIANSVKATRSAQIEQLYQTAYDRMDELFAMGVTTAEGKSGYGLDLETELRQLEVMEELNTEHPMDLVRTFLGAHAIPTNYADRPNDYIDFVIHSVLPRVKEAKLAEFCDVFCEKGVFSIAQSAHLLQAAKAMGFGLKLHADEIVTLGGAELAVRLGAVSADHLLHVSDEGIQQLAASSVIATLLPLTAFSLNEPYAPGRRMIDAGCAVALASDYNPGSCFSGSIPLLFALACIQMKFTPEEAVTALTINGAAAIGKADSIGSIDVGKKADLVLLRYPSYKFLPYHVGMNCVETVIKSGIPYLQP